MAAPDRSGPRKDRLFRAVSENNESVLSNMLRIAAASGFPTPLGDLVADFEYAYYGVSAKGLTLRQFARTLISQGHDRHGVLSLLDRDPETAPAATARDFGGAAPTSSAPPAMLASLPPQCRSDAADGAALLPPDGVVGGLIHPTIGLLEVGQQLLHDTKDLLTVLGAGQAPGMVECAQFNRNSKPVSVPIESLLAIPALSSCGAIWRYNVFGGNGAMWLGDALPTTKRFRPQVEAKLEAVYQAGPPASGEDWALTYLDVHHWNSQQYVSTANLTTMAIQDNLGHKRIMMRSDPDAAIVSLGLLELAAAVASKQPVQIRGKGVGTVLFVNDDSAKVELATGKKTFIPIADIFAGTVDLAAEAVWRNRVLNLNKCAPAKLSKDAVTPGHSFELLPLTDVLIEQYRQDQRRSQWQYRPGTEWSAFPAESAAKLSACFSNSAALDAADQHACMFVGSYKRNSVAGNLRIARTRSTPALLSASSAYVCGIDELQGGDGCQRMYPMAKLTSIATDAGPDAMTVARDSVAAFKMATGCAAVEVVDLALEAGDNLGGSPRIVLRLDDTVLGFQGGVPFRENAEGVVTPDDAMLGRLGVDRTQAVAYLIEIPASCDGPIVVSSPTVAGLGDGLLTLTRSVALEDVDGSPTPCLPACYIADVALPGGRHRFAVATTTTLQTADQFVIFAHEARLYQPSHERLIRRAVAFSRRDNKEIVIKGHGLGTLVDCDQAGTAEVTVQFYREPDHQNYIDCPELRRFPQSDAFLPPTCRTTGLDWSTAVFSECAGSGKGEVMFIEFPNQKVAVLKRTDEPACELAGYRVGHLLGIPMPPLVVLHAAIGEGQEIAPALCRLGLAGRVRSVSRGSGSSAQRASNWLAVQELQPGSTLKDLCHRQQANSGWAAKIFGPDDTGQRRLQDLGRMIAFDVLVHNSDRWYLPGIFESMSRCGNMANIMISPAGDPIAIDNTCNAFDTSSPKSAAHFDDFISAVRELASVTRNRVEGHPGAPETAHPALESVRAYLRDGQGHPGHAAYIPAPCHDIGAEGTRQVEVGFMAVVAQLHGASFAASIRGLEAEISAELGWLEDEWTSLDLPRVKADFFLAVAEALCGGAVAKP